MESLTTSHPMAGTMIMDIWKSSETVSISQWHVAVVLYYSVPEFEASQYLVTNGEFLQFVESGGYQNKDLWTDEGINCIYTL